MFKWLWRSFLFISVSIVAAEDSQSVTIYTYHDKPPYYYLNDETGEPIGIYVDLITAINNRNDRLDFQLRYLPRGRINVLLSSGQLRGGVIGVAPQWFGDPDMSKYLWSDPFMMDKDIVVTRPGLELDYQSPADLQGLTIALANGFYFRGVTELIEAQVIESYNTESEYQNLKMLEAERVDVSIVGELSFRYFLQQDPEHYGQLVVEEIPHDRFQRYLFLVKQGNSDQSQVMNQINQAIESFEVKIQ